MLSLPRLSIEQGAACGECHISPSGAGMRNEFGNYSVAFSELALPQLKNKVSQEYVSPRVAPSLLVGFDSRYLIFDDGTIFRMQTDAFLNFEPLKEIQYQLRIGEDPVGEFRAFESFMLFKPSSHLFVKAGRFAPSFGLHVDDHKSFVRDRTGNGSNPYLDGFAIGGKLGRFHSALEFFNPSDVGTINWHSYAVGEYGSVGYMGGASLRFGESRSGLDSGLPDNRALFGGLNYDRYTIMGEYDLVGSYSEARAVYGSVTTRLEYGLYLIG
ncbi:MAG: hypothetical protein P1R58_05885, partial [bacterium]|nr:hypothetical protein [bacterium]